MSIILKDYEIEKLKLAFPHTLAPLKQDYDQFEIDAMTDLGILKNHPHIYLGKH